MKYQRLFIQWRLPLKGTGGLQMFCEMTQCKWLTRPACLPALPHLKYPTAEKIMNVLKCFSQAWVNLPFSYLVVYFGVCFIPIFNVSVALNQVTQNHIVQNKAVDFLWENQIVRRDTIVLQYFLFFLNFLSVYFQRYIGNKLFFSVFLTRYHTMCSIRVIFFLLPSPYFNINVLFLSDSC